MYMYTYLILEYENTLNFLTWRKAVIILILSLFEEPRFEEFICLDLLYSEVLRW